MNLKKKAQCVMLPTDKAEGCLLKGLGTLQRFPDKYFTQEYLIETKRTSHHLYIIDDSEIKEGDYCFDKILNTIFQTDEYTDFEYINQTDNVLKVIASTDKSLNLPSPSEQFIQKYVESYNKGIIISEVNIEYELWAHTEENPQYKLKVDSKNQVTITRCKETWGKNDEELIKAFEEFACAVYDENYKKDMSFKKRAELMSKNWIKENL